MEAEGLTDWNRNDNPELRLTSEQMRELGYRAIDMVVEHFDVIGSRPVSRLATRNELEERLREPIPEAPVPPEQVFRSLERDVLAHMIHVDHPRNFGFVPGPSNFVGVLGDLLASGFNVFAGTWLEAAGPAEVELVTIDWLREICELPLGTGGLFVSGGSAANLTALMVAREEKLPEGPGAGVAYLSDQTHSSVERAFRVLGFLPGQIRRVATDERFRLSIEALQAAVAEDRATGRKPFCVVANAGTTNTGAVDPLDALVPICRRENLWLHADGAYGAVAMLSPRHRALLSGLSDVDSLSLDPHKWLFQPYEAGCVLVREGGLLREHFQVFPEYLKDVAAAGEEVNFCDRGMQLTRSFRALKLWMTMKIFGLKNLRRAVEHGIEMAEYAESLLRARKDFEVVTGAQLGIVSFRWRARDSGDADELNKLNRRLATEVIEDGFALVSSTELDGKTVLRICPINPRTTKDDMVKSVARIEEIARRL